MTRSPQEHFQQFDRFAAANGIEMIEVRPGYAEARLKIEDRHLNSVGTVHGGALSTLADFAFAGACNGAGQLALGLNMLITCVRAVSRGTLVARAKEVARSRRISTCVVEVTDEQGGLVAHFQGTAYIKSSPFPPLSE